jgi:hypothetical protein
LRYRPSGEVAAAIAVPGNVVLAAAEPATALLFSADGVGGWEQLALQPGLPATTVGANFTAPGVFLPAAAQPAGAGFQHDQSRTGVWVALAVGVVAVTIGVPFTLRARRRRVLRREAERVAASKAQRRRTQTRRRRR